jgi:hypothetical protein
VKGDEPLTSLRLKLIMTAITFLSACSSGHALTSLPIGDLSSEDPGVKIASLQESSDNRLYRADSLSSDTKAPVFKMAESDIEEIKSKFRAACARDFQNPEKFVIDFGETPDHKLIGGYFSSLSLRAEGGGVDYVKLKSFRMECQGVHFDLPSLLADGKLDVRLVDSMDMAVSVKEEAFNDLFTAHAGRMAVSNPEIRMHENEISFSGTVKAFLIKSRVNARGPLELTSDGKVNFNLNRLKVSGVRLPGFVVRKISSTINPIADFNKFKFWKCWNMQLKSVTVKPGQLTLSSFDSNDAESGPKFAETVLDTEVLSELQKG